MEQADDSTAVVRIRGNFQDFISRCSSESTAKRLKFDSSSLCESGLSDIGKDSYVQRSEVIAAKAEVTQLQAHLKSLEFQQKEAALKHEQEINKLVKDHEKEIAKFADVRNQFLVLAKKEKERKQELTELRQELDKAKGSDRTRVTTQKEKILLQVELEQMKQDMENKIRNLEMEKKNLMWSLQQAQTEMNNQEQLLTTFRDGSDRNLRIQQEAENFRSQLSNANIRIKELEMTVSRFEEDGKVVQMMKSQLTQLKQFSKENKTLKEENQYLSAVQKNTHLLTEENNDLRSKVERLQRHCTELSKYEVLCEDLQKRLSKWENIDDTNPIKSPTHMRQHTAELQREVRQLLEKNGQLQASNHTLEESCKASLSQLQTKKEELASVTAKFQTANDLIRRLRKKLIFVSEENELFKNIVDKYNHHDDDLTSQVDTRATVRIQHLERLLEKHQKQVNSLQSDLEGAAEESSQLKMKTVMLEQQLRQAEREPTFLPPTVSATSEVDQNIILSLRQKVADLEKQVEELTDQKEEVEAQLERVDIQGVYDRTKTRVVHYRMNPYSLTRNRLTQEMDQLREENARLSAKLNVMKETGNQDEDLSVIVEKNVCPPGTAKELEDTKNKLASEQLKNQRLVEAFKKTSQDLREINYKVLGYRVDVQNPGEYQLMSMYAESPNDYFLFKQSSSGELQLLGNKYSEAFQKNIETYLTVSNSLPAFMSSVTLDLYGRQTIMQS